MKRVRLIAALAPILIGLFAFHPEVLSEPLSKDEVEDLITDARIPFTSSRGNPGRWHYMPDKRIRSTIDSPVGPIVSEGRWWIEPNGLLCRQYDRWAGDSRTCVFLEPDGERFLTLDPDGTPRDHTWTIQK